VSTLKTFPEPTIRPATVDDAENIARLSTQLGYPSTTEQTVQRLLKVNERGGHAIYVAETGGVVVGWVHVFVSCSVVTDTSAEIGGLVVNETHRGRGIGRMLMQQAEHWAREHGCRSVQLRSNVLRSRAHSSYERLGYQVIKSQKAFRKELD
jgi:GNAT superfamily N-acetyltransferase